MMRAAKMALVAVLGIILFASCTNMKKNNNEHGNYTETPKETSLTMITTDTNTLIPTAVTTEICTPTVLPTETLTDTSTLIPTAVTTEICTPTMSPTEILTDTSTTAPTDVPESTNPPHSIPPQPITFDNYNGAIDFVNNPDYSKYPDYYAETYKNMVQRFQAEGKLYKVVNDFAETYIERVTLYPNVTYEDIGVGAWFKYKDNLFNVIVYYADPSININLEQGDNMEKYYNERMGVNISFDKFILDNSYLSQASFTTSSSGTNIVRCAIDGTHYLCVKADVSNDDMIDFINGLKFDFVSIT